MKLQKSQRLHKLWKLMLLIISTFLALHFLKDITQDILKIQTPLDYMGDIQEDLSFLPKWLLPVYYVSWVLATIAQLVIIYYIFQTWKHDTFNKNDKIIIYLLLFFLAMGAWAFILAL